MTNAADKTQEPKTKNRFVVKRTGRKPYTSTAQFVRAIGEHLTPDIWDAIVVRAVQDAMLGRNADRTKAREFLAKHLLGERTKLSIETPDHSMSSVGALLTEMFELLQDGFMEKTKTEQDAREVTRDALAIVLARLKPDERQLLREALTESETPEAQTWLDEMSQQTHE
jgi:hypothetical protein